MSRSQIGSSRQTAEKDDGGQYSHLGEIDVIMDQDDADVISVCSDSSDEQDDVQDVIPYVHVPRRGRRYRRNAEMLGPVCGQRLRTRR